MGGLKRIMAGKVKRSRFQIYFRADMTRLAKELDVKGEGKGGIKDPPQTPGF